MKVRSDIGAEPAARFAHEALFQVREPDVVRSRVCADREGMAAMEVRAIDQETARAGGAHFSKGDFLRSAGGGGHAAIEAPALNPHVQPFRPVAAPVYRSGERNPYREPVRSEMAPRSDQ
jgi:hypothetical protein